MIILAIIPIVFLFSCASAPAVNNNDAWPEWLANHPQAPSNANYNYIVKDGTGRTEEEAMKNALEKAHREAASIIGRPLGETYGIRYGIRCYHHIEKNIYNHTVYILFKHQIKSMASGAQDDYSNPDGIKCNSVPIENADKNTEEAAVIGEKQGSLLNAIAGLRAVAEKFESSGNIKQRNEIMGEGSRLYGEINKLQGELRILNAVIGLDSTMEAVRNIYGKLRASCIEYGKSARLHWNSEQENEYSEIAFSVLSKKLRIEKSLCQGDGVSLTYKSDEPDCSPKFGLHSCTSKISLSASSCKGVEYLLLENAVGGVHQNPDFALERMRDRLRSAEFWDKWVQEIQLWGLQCIE